MPHAVTETMEINGDSNSSKTLSHFTSYPTIATGIDKAKSHPVGKKSVDIANDVYSRFGKPVENMLDTPYQYAKPYLNKADELGDKALGTIDSYVPIVKENPDTIWDSAISTALAPLQYAKETYDDEYTKVSRSSDQRGLVFLIKVLLSFVLHVIADAYNFLMSKAEPAKDRSAEYLKLAQQTADDARKYADEKAAKAKKMSDDYAKKLSENGQSAKETAEQKGSEAKGKAEETAEQGKSQAKETANQAKGQAKKAQ